jgi:hypothetical protein
MNFYLFIIINADNLNVQEYECESLWQLNVRYQKKKQENIKILSIQWEQKDCKKLTKI